MIREYGSRTHGLYRQTHPGSDRNLDPTGAVNVDRSVWAFNAVFLDSPMAPDVPQDEFRLIVRNGQLGESCPGQ